MWFDDDRIGARWKSLYMYFNENDSSTEATRVVVRLHCVFYFKQVHDDIQLKMDSLFCIHFYEGCIKVPTSCFWKFDDDDEKTLMSIIWQTL